MSTTETPKQTRTGKAMREFLLAMYNVGHPIGARDLSRLTGRDPDRSRNWQHQPIRQMHERGWIDSVPYSEKRPRWRKWYLTEDGKTAAQAFMADPS